VLAELAECVERFLSGVAIATAQNADGLVDDRARLQCSLQLSGQPLALGEDLRVEHRDRRGYREHFTHLLGVGVEGVMGVGVDVHRAEHSARSPQGHHSTLCTPSRPARGPKRGHRESPPSDPDRIVRPSAAALLHGPWPMPYWMSSICRMRCIRPRPRWFLAGSCPHWPRKTARTLMGCLCTVPSGVHPCRWRRPTPEVATASARAGPARATSYCLRRAVPTCFWSVDEC